MTKEIGGYFELELRKGEEYYNDAIHLNAGRYCLEYVLLTKGFTKVYLPYYVCEVLLEPMKKLNIEYEFYSVDINLDPLFSKDLSENEAFIYVNYFGVKQSTVESLSKKIKNLIIDNSQAFYSKPIQGVDTFYSPRKFFGVSDGAYLYTNQKNDYNFEQDHSWNRMAHLLRRIDESAATGFQTFKENDALLSNQSILKMSKLTQGVLGSIDYAIIAKVRRDNFLKIHSKLSFKNKINISIDSCEAPMVYPYFVDNGEELKLKLIENKIYVATYWTNILPYVKENSIEYDLVKNLVPIPIDQRLNVSDLEKIIDLIV